MPRQRTIEIKRRRTRRQKLAKVRIKFKDAKTDAERARLVEKAFKVSPTAVLE